jgi:hypothetical protein
MSETTVDVCENGSDSCRDWSDSYRCRVSIVEVGRCNVSSVIIIVWVVHRQSVRAQRCQLLVRIFIGIEEVKTFFGLNVKRGGKGNCFRGSSRVVFLFASPLLPLQYTGPILRFFLVKIFFPFRLRFAAVLADMTTLMTASAIAALDVIVELALGFGCDLVAVNCSFEIGSFETSRELSRLFMLGATGEVGVVGAFVFVLGFILSFVVLSFAVFGLRLISFLLRGPGL